MQHSPLFLLGDGLALINCFSVQESQADKNPFSEGVSIVEKGLVRQEK